MAVSLELKACRACAKAKRKCDKERPACRRCRDRGAECDYPPTRPGSFVALRSLEELTPPPVDPVFQPPQSSAFTNVPGSGPSPPLTSSSPATSAAVSGPASLGSRLCVAWFLASHTWKIDKRAGMLSISICSSFLKTYITTIQEWLDRWTKTGECPFIHTNLYVARFPECLQIAYATLTSYVNRTENNTEIILKIVEDQASKLLSDNGVTPGGTALNTNGNTGTDSSKSLSLLDQLARTHALLIYQTIGLFDGDIRTRHLAEGRLHILSNWAMQLLDSACQKFSSPSVVDMTVALHYGPMDSLEHPWYLWILSESIRRTWLIAHGLVAVYYMLQRGWYDCPGGVMYTTRQGVWDARAALSWEKICTEKDVGFLQRFESERLFTESSPDEVDEFSKSMMEITFGLERMEKWKHDKQSS